MDRKNWIAVKVPYGGGYCSLNLAKLEGTKYAPDALLKEFKRQGIFLADNGVSVDQLEWREIDISLWPRNDIMNWTKVDEIIYTESLNLYKKPDLKPLFLGGSHTISYSTIRALKATVGKEAVGLVVLDAHPDCCKKDDWPIHSDWLRCLIENHYVLSENVLIIGLRQIEKSEKEFLDKFNIKHYRMSTVRDVESFVMNDISVMRVLEKFRKLAAMYISIDIDVASGAYAPGTGSPSPGGVTDKELISLAKQFKVALPNLKVADIVEINPLNWWRKRILRYDPTVDLGVKLIKEIIS